jgi:hypothetical protein
MRPRSIVAAHTPLERAVILLAGLAFMLMATAAVWMDAHRPQFFTHDLPLRAWLPWEEGR